MSRPRSQKAAECKRARESSVIQEMVGLFCHGVHSTTKGNLCPECAELLAYAQKRVARCPFMETKTFCSQCQVHCYAPAEREKIREVMRYVGPRFMFHHPLMCAQHGADTMAGALRKRREAGSGT